jgi:hypothetical protein
MSEEIEDVNNITYEEFIEKLYSINPVGNAEIYYSQMLKVLGTKLYDGKILTFELLVKRYQEYFNYMFPFNNIKEKQYIKKDKEIKGVGEYIILNMYRNDYSQLMVTDNDFYLFGI